MKTLFTIIGVLIFSFGYFLNHAYNYSECLGKHGYDYCQANAIMYK